MCYAAHGRDYGQWEGKDPKVVEWFRGLKQPDNPVFSCCGEADAYWCDDVHVKNGHTFCGITDDRADEPLKRRHVPVGTIIPIPDHKLKWDEGNPTGHVIVFLSISEYLSADGETDVSKNSYGVYCFVLGSGT